MKTIINRILIIACVVLAFTTTSCKKDKETVKVKQTRLKTYTYTSAAYTSTYTIAYNAAGKISTVQYVYNGSLYSTKNCFYKSGNVLDSIVENYVAGGSSSYKIIWTGDKITKYGDTKLSYNSNGVIDKKTYASGDYFRNAVNGDSVLLYYKTFGGNEYISARYKLSATIKNPFLITGFEKEAYVTSILFYYNNGFNALLPNIESAEISYSGSQSGIPINYTFDGDFNGYPLKRTGTKSTETYTYEEFYN